MNNEKGRILRPFCIMNLLLCILADAIAVAKNFLVAADSTIG